MNDALQNLLKQLRLSGLLSTLEVRLHEAAASQLGHRDFLELILQDELAVRNDRLMAVASRPPSSVRSRRSISSTGVSTPPSPRS